MCPDRQWWIDDEAPPSHSGMEPRPGAAVSPTHVVDTLGVAPIIRRRILTASTSVDSAVRTRRPRVPRTLQHQFPILRQLGAQPGTASPVSAEEPTKPPGRLRTTPQRRGHHVTDLSTNSTPGQAPKPYAIALQIHMRRRTSRPSHGDPNGYAAGWDIPLRMALGTATPRAHLHDHPHRQHQLDRHNPHDAAMSDSRFAVGCRDSAASRSSLLVAVDRTDAARWVTPG